jgi:hypothetical protein
MRIEIPLAGGQVSGRVSKANDQLTQNFYVKQEKPGGKNKASLYSTAGLNSVGTIGIGPARSDPVVFKDKQYIISGGEFYERLADGTTTLIDTLNTYGPRASMAVGFDYILIVDGTNGYTYDGTTFAVITDVNFPNGAQTCTYLDGRFVVEKPSTLNYQWSNLEDPTTWPATNLGSAEGNSDNIVAVTSNDKDLYLVGDITTEVHYNTGSTTQLFAPYQNGLLEIGTPSPFSVRNTTQGIFMHAQDAEGQSFVVMISGQTFQKISNTEIDWEIDQLALQNDGIGFAYRLAGKLFYTLTFPAGDKTFEFNVSEDGLQWATRSSFGIGRWRANAIGYFNGDHIVGDYNTGEFFKLDYNTLTEGGNSIERLRRVPVVHSNNKRMKHVNLVLDIESGVGLDGIQQGDDPQLMMRYSDDGGKTWSNELWKSMGKIGEYSKRLRWNKLGISRGRIYEFKVTDPVQVTLLGLYLDAVVLGE